MQSAQQFFNLQLRIAPSIRDWASFVFAPLKCVLRYRNFVSVRCFAAKNACLIALFDQLSALTEQAVASTGSLALPLPCWGGS
jgi:hypothetical protein